MLPPGTARGAEGGAARDQPDSAHSRPPAQ